MAVKRKSPIPKALREQVWLKYVGKEYSTKCKTTWCENNINVFDFQCGHNIPESKGGPTTIENLLPICSRCNLSMSDKYSFDEWCTKFKTVPVVGPPTSPFCFGFCKPSA
jgi:HNH endonuclease